MIKLLKRLFIILLLFGVWKAYNSLKTEYTAETNSTKTANIENTEKLFVIGDLHGDFNNTMRVLKTIGWKEGDTLIQIGDVVDRGHDTQQLYNFFIKRPNTISLLGNHEIMNLLGDWRYVTDKDISTFKTQESRQKAFSKEGWIGKELRKWPAVVLRNRILFVHGGLRLEWAELFGVNGLNELVWKEMEAEHWEHKVFGVNGPFWFRGFVEWSEERACLELGKVLEVVGAERMVVGHTPQIEGKVLSRCGGRFLDVDVGISWAYGGNVAGLVVEEGKVTAVYSNKREEV